MKAFEYAQPTTQAEALALLSPEPGKCELLAGGSDLVGLLEKMVLTPDRVVNIAEIDSMQQIEADEIGGGVAIGAAVHLDDALDSPLLAMYPAMMQVISGLGSMQAQAQSTIGGDLFRRPSCWYFRSGNGLLAGGGRMVALGDNRFHAILGNDGPAKFVSASRLAPALIALGATARVIGPAIDDEEFLPLEELYRTPSREGQRETALLPNQVVSHVILPPGEGTSGIYEAKHGAGPGDPMAAAAAALRIEGGVVREAKIVLGQVAPTPWVSREAARAIVGQRVTPETAAAAGRAAVAKAAPLSQNEYKVQLARVAVKRAILTAGGLETGGF